MPHRPVVGVPPVLIPRVVVVSSRGGRGRPIKGAGIFHLQNLRDNIFKNLNIIALLLDGRLPCTVQRLRLHLVVAAPEPQTGMVADPAHIVPNLRADIALKIIVQLIGSAGKHEILPHNQPQLVTDVKKPVVRVITAAPHTNAVVVCRRRVLQQAAGALRRDSGKNIVFRDVVRAHGKDFHPVDLMGKALAPLVLFRIYRQRAKPDPAAPFVKHMALLVQKRHLRTVKGLLSETVRPPASRVFHGDGVPVIPVFISRIFCTLRLLLRPAQCPAL